MTFISNTRKTFLSHSQQNLGNSIFNTKRTNVSYKTLKALNLKLLNKNSLLKNNGDYISFYIEINSCDKQIN